MGYDTKRYQSRASFRARSAEMHSIFRGLRKSGGARTHERNIEVGGAQGSKHLDNIDMAHDYVGSQADMEQARDWLLARGQNAIVHDVGSGMHLHYQGLPKGNIPAEWLTDNPVKGIDPRPQIVPQPSSPEGKVYAQELAAEKLRTEQPTAEEDPAAEMKAQAAAIMAAEREPKPAPREYGNIIPEHDPGYVALEGPELGWALPDAPISVPELKGPELPFAEGAHGAPEPKAPISIPTDLNITLEGAPEWKMPGKRGMMLARKKADQSRTRRKVQAEYKQMLAAPVATINTPLEKPFVSKGLASMGPRRNRR